MALLAKESLFKEVIETEAELRDMIGKPSKLAQQKVIDHIDNHCREFIAHSPFLVLSTSNRHGRSDTSPRGDKPGFVHVLDDKHLIIPDRRGNKRMDSMVNILSNPFVSLLFFIPVLGETLRVKGKAKLIRDDNYLSELEVNGKTPMLAIAVEVEECFIHCAKAILRSGLWNPEAWGEKESVPKAAKMLAAHAKITDVEEQKNLERSLQEGYRNRLY